MSPGRLDKGDLALDFGDIAAYDIYPNPLPDLFSGSHIIALGRYRKGAETDVILRGEFNNEEISFVYEDQSFASDSLGHDPTLAALPRLWATRKIGYLLNRVRLDGADQETIDQIVRLSIRYGIVTPYTSYLVTEEMPLGEAEQGRIAEEAYVEAQSMPPTEPSGQEAVFVNMTGKELKTQKGVKQQRKFQRNGVKKIAEGKNAITLLLAQFVLVLLSESLVQYVEN